MTAKRLSAPTLLLLPAVLVLAVWILTDQVLWAQGWDPLRRH